MRPALKFLLAAACACSFAGCSTPASRIEKNLDLFNTFPLEAQAKIRQGEVDIGFTPDMVRIAKGDPPRTYVRQTAEGQTEVWSYVAFDYRTERQRIQVDVPYYDNAGHRRTHNDWVWADVQSTEEYETLRIEFRDGKVSAIETVSR